MAFALNVLTCLFVGVAAYFWLKSARVQVSPQEALDSFHRDYEAKHGKRSEWDPSQIIESDSKGREYDLGETLKLQFVWNARAAGCACVAAGG